MIIKVSADIFIDLIKHRMSILTKCLYKGAHAKFEKGFSIMTVLVCAKLTFLTVSDIPSLLLFTICKCKLNYDARGDAHLSITA